MMTGYLTALRLLGTVAVLTLLYYLLPIRGPLTSASWTVVFVCGAVVLGLLLLLHVGSLLKAGPDVQLQRLLVLLCVIVLFFAEAYYLLAQTPGQLTDLHTKTDALYFTVTTLSTVGYGDVHAAGQLARVAVTLQIVYDLFFIGLAVAVGTGLLRAKAAQRTPRHSEQTSKTPSGTAPGSGAPESGPGPAGGSPPAN